MTAGRAPPGTVAITAVEPERMWASGAGIPFGRLRGENRYEPLADRRIRVSKRVEVHRPFGPLFHLIWEKRVRRHARELRRAGGRGEAAWLTRPTDG
ncbi:MAG TPA: hypothetical protein VNO54_13290 [Streptosporangiaceae bacterium]|nr:hypothetical protein [Streptosporangiaceae bacterium]